MPRCAMALAHKYWLQCHHCCSMLLVRHSNAASAYEQPNLLLSLSSLAGKHSWIARLINELMNKFDRACIKIQNGGFFASWIVFLLASWYWYLYQPQCWKKIQNYRFRDHKLLTISIGSSSQWNFGKKMHWDISLFFYRKAASSHVESKK